jgi:hypothetical protein
MEWTRVWLEVEDSDDSRHVRYIDVPKGRTSKRAVKDFRNLYGIHSGYIRVIKRESSPVNVVSI